MKKYKLIKEYPGSPKIDSVVETKSYGGYALENSTFYFMTKDKVENQPEFWQEVIEKDYEILSYIHNGSKHIWKKDSQLKDTFCLEDGKSPFTRLEDILKYPKIYLIHSVKRLSDGEVFTVGDICSPARKEYDDNVHPINRIWISDPGYLRLSSVNYTLSLDTIQKVKQPLLTTEVIEKDYEILSFKTDSGKLSLLQSNGNYFVEDNTGGVKFNPDGYYRGYTAEEELKHDSEIHSVKRLSDGEVFTIGDIINTKVDNEYKQEIIEINLGMNNTFFKDRLMFKTKVGYVVIDIAVKYKQPLFTKVVEKDYEILSYISKLKNCIIEPKNPLFNNGVWDIHSIKRLSDGEIFTIGDNIIGFYNIIAKINSINLVGEVSLIINSDTHEGFSLKNLKKSKLPLFTTKVVEKDYEILKFILPGNNILHIQDAKNPLEFMLNNPDVYKIYSIKRNDGEIFTIGDRVTYFAGEKYDFNITSIKEDHIHRMSLYGKEGAYTVLCSKTKHDTPKVIKQPLLTIEVVEKDYEILSIIPNNDLKGIIFNYNCPEIKSYLKFGDYKIHSVKRLSDSEVFTVGDKVDSTISDLGRATDLTGFKIIDNKLIVGLRHLGYYPLATIILPKQPLFTTEDGVDIYEGDEVTWVFSDNSGIAGTRKAEAEMYRNLKYFSTKEKAQEYVLMNESKYSINDILASLPNRKCEKYISIKQMIENLKNM